MTENSKNWWAKSGRDEAACRELLVKALHLKGDGAGEVHRGFRLLRRRAGVPEGAGDPRLPGPARRLRLHRRRVLRDVDQAEAAALPPGQVGGALRDQPGPRLPQPPAQVEARPEGKFRALRQPRRSPDGGPRVGAGATGSPSSCGATADLPRGTGPFSVLLTG